MSNPNDNVTKMNGSTVDPMQRLASFKPPRDLSLGGAKLGKKIFTPNLNVSRNKNKGASSNNFRDPKKNDKEKKDRKNDKNRNLRNGPNIIKSGGVFSEGIGSGQRQQSISCGSYIRNTESKSDLQKPTIRVKDVVKIDRELEEQRIRAVMSQDSVGNDDGEDFKNIIDNEAPIKLPMDDGGWLYSKSKSSAVQVKQEVVPKTEPEDIDGMLLSIDTKPVVPVVKKEVFDEPNVVNLLKNDQPTLILLTLPDSLPGRGGVSEDEPRHKPGDQPSTSNNQNQAEEQKTAENRCQLKNLEEGRIGKLRIHRSGRVTFVIGNTTFEVNLGTKSAFYQEVVSVAADDSSRSARLVALGPLQHKLTAVPEWESLFTDMSS